MIRWVLGIGVGAAVAFDVMRRMKEVTETTMVIGDPEGPGKPGRVRTPPGRLAGRRRQTLTWQVTNERDQALALTFEEFTHRPVFSDPQPSHPISRVDAPLSPQSTRAISADILDGAQKGRHTYAIYLDGVKIYNTPEIVIKG